MNQTLPTCANCSTPFWPNGQLNPDPRSHICENCTSSSSVGLALSSDASLEPPSGQPIEVIRRVASQPAAQVEVRPRVAVRPRQLPGTAAAPVPQPVPAQPQTLSFNCPACMAFLSVSRDLAIAGTTAPCPHCSSMVIPPRIAPCAAPKSSRESRWRPDR